MSKRDYKNTIGNGEVEAPPTSTTEHTSAPSSQPTAKQASPHTSPTQNTTTAEGQDGQINTQPPQSENAPQAAPPQAQYQQPHMQQQPPQQPMPMPNVHGSMPMMHHPRAPMMGPNGQPMPHPGNFQGPPGQQPIRMLPPPPPGYHHPGMGPPMPFPLYGHPGATPQQLRTLKRKQDVLGMSAAMSTARRSRGGGVDKNSKGLRHFSLKVCEKVRQKGRTSYNEVADELVAELTSAMIAPRTQSRRGSDNLYDSKNIRRRVYDALNVLMAMNIIAKEKKEIRWVGLPANSAEECMQLQGDCRARQERIRKKKAHLYELIIQQVAFKNLVRRNSELEAAHGRYDDSKLIQLPYIIVNTATDTQIDCEMAEDGTEYFFQFSGAFEIHDEIEVLKRMHMAKGLDQGAVPEDCLHDALSLVPEDVRHHVVETASRQEMVQLRRSTKRYRLRTQKAIQKRKTHMAAGGLKRLSEPFPPPPPLLGVHPSMGAPMSPMGVPWPPFPATTPPIQGGHMHMAQAYMGQQAPYDEEYSGSDEEEGDQHVYGPVPVSAS